MTIDYRLGLDISLYVSTIFSILFIALAFFKVIKNKKITSLSNKSIVFKIIVYILGLILMFVSIYILLFISAFSIINLLLNLLSQPLYSLEFFKDFFMKELNNGIIQLRVTSIMITFTAILNALRIAYSSRQSQKINILSTNLFPQYPEIENLKEVVPINNLLVAQYLQYAFYTYILATLWTLNITENVSLWSRFAAFFIFFIIDDWIIIADYEIGLKGRIINTHSRKINGFNILLLVLSTLSVFTTESLYTYRSIFILISILILAVRYNIQINNLKEKL